MSESLLNILSQTGQLFLLFPLLTGVLKFQRLKGVMRIMIFLLIMAFVISALAWYLWSKSLNNLPLLHLYTLLEFCGWAFIYYRLMGEHKSRSIILISGVCFILFSVVNSIFIQKLSNFNSYSRALECLLLIGFSIIYFFKLFREKKIQRLENEPTFWMNASVLGYFSGSFLLFGFSNLLLNLGSYEIKEVWAVHGIFLMVHYTLLTIALWIAQASAT